MNLFAFNSDLAFVALCIAYIIKLNIVFAGELQYDVSTSSEVKDSFSTEEFLTKLSSIYHTNQINTEESQQRSGSDGHTPDDSIPIKLIGNQLFFSNQSSLVPVHELPGFQTSKHLPKLDPTTTMKVQMRTTGHMVRTKTPTKQSESPKEQTTVTTTEKSSKILDILLETSSTRPDITLATGVRKENHTSAVSGEHSLSTKAHEMATSEILTSDSEQSTSSYAMSTTEYQGSSDSVNTTVNQGTILDRINIDTTTMPHTKKQEMTEPGSTEPTEVHTTSKNSKRLSDKDKNTTEIDLSTDSQETSQQTTTNLDTTVVATFTKAVQNTELSNTTRDANMTQKPRNSKSSSPVGYHTTKPYTSQTTRKASNTEQTKTSSVQTMPLEGTAESANRTRLQIPIPAEDDTYWPIAMALAIGIPTIIVVAVTITAIHRKRKLEMAHSSLMGYNAAPTEYDA